MNFLKYQKQTNVIKYHQSSIYYQKKFKLYSFVMEIILYYTDEQTFKWPLSASNKFDGLISR